MPSLIAVTDSRRFMPGASQIVALDDDRNFFVDGIVSPNSMTLLWTSANHGKVITTFPTCAFDSRYL